MKNTYHSTTVWGKPYSLGNFRRRDVCTIQQQCGFLRHFHEQNIPTLQQQCGANCSRLVNFRERNACTISDHTGTYSGSVNRQVKPA